MKTYVLYHANCYDGFGAAWAAWRKLGDDAEYIAVKYGAPPPPDIADGSTVYVVDFSYPRKTLLELKQRLEKLVILDHHKTAQEDLRDLDFAIFDMNKSGATITWEYFHPEEKVPELLLYIEDRDLWRFKLSCSKQVSTALRSWPMSFERWSGLATIEGMENLMRDGIIVERFTDVMVEMMCGQAVLEERWGHKVAVVNATGFWSEIGEHLLERFPEAEFSASYFDRADGMRQWSLRSKDDFDVSAVARRMGGGGHKNAAGFQMAALPSAL